MTRSAPLRWLVDTAAVCELDDAEPVAVEPAAEPVAVEATSSPVPPAVTVLVGAAIALRLAT